MATKRDRALSEYRGHKGQATLAHVERNINQAYPTAFDDLTGVQYGRLLNVANQSFHDGRASVGASIESGCLVVKGLPLLPIDLLRSIRVVEHTEYVYSPVKPGGGQDPLSHLSGPRSFYRLQSDGTYTQITSQDVPGTEYWPDWQRAQALLPEQLYLREQWSITAYYIGDNPIYTERV